MKAIKRMTKEVRIVRRERGRERRREERDKVYESKS